MSVAPRAAIPTPAPSAAPAAGRSIAPATPTAARRRVVTMLVLRLVLFAAFQTLAAIALAVSGADDAWRASAAWWPLTATAANLVTLALLVRFAHADGIRLRSIFLPDGSRWKRDLGAAALITLAAMPLAALPNIGLAALLFGDPQVALDLFVQPLPMWAAVAAVILFPITTALAELPTYYGYVQPQLARLGAATWVVIVVPALFHAVQHATLPLIFDPAFVAWRALMFLPFALLLAATIRLRPGALPFLLVVHFALDTQAVLMVLAAS